MPTATFYTLGRVSACPIKLHGLSMGTTGSIRRDSRYRATAWPGTGVAPAFRFGRWSVCVRAQQALRVKPVDMAHEGRVDGVADQFARPLRQLVGDVGRNGERHVLE